MNPLPPSPSANRRYDLDWLRVLAFGLLIFYHTGMFFVSWDWHIKNNVLSEAIEWPMIFLGQWRMSLLFLVSGAAVYFALKRRSIRAFAGERVKRIFLPLVFGMFVVVPPQIYFERLSQGQTYSYTTFYRSVFAFQPYPEGSFSWHHLWYLAYIFVYSLLCLPLFGYLQSQRGRRTREQIVLWLSKPASLLLIPALGLSIGEVLLRGEWPATNDLIHDWASHFQYLTLFIIGFTFVSAEKFAVATQKNRYWSLMLALATVTILYARYWTDWQELSDTEEAAYFCLKSFNRWWWLLTILSFAKKYLSFSRPGLRYANEAVYPFYILHQTVIIFLAYPITHWALPVGLKFVLISAWTFLLCWLLYAYLIQRISILRPLFGLKPVSKVNPVPAVQFVSHS